jgi:hypothetical protein
MPSVDLCLTDFDLIAMQTTSHLLMIRPVQFTFNAETAVNNAFQSTHDSDAQKKALQEFNNFVQLLGQHGVDVTVIDDTPEPHTPDSIFPNNWVSFHDDGRLVLYPMYAVNRRLERKPYVIEKLKTKFNISSQIDFSFYEKENIFLEGTGSMVLDRENKIAYACLSPRTDLVVLKEFSSTLGYTPISFTSTDANGLPIYHTNVMMCVADRYVVICLETIKNKTEEDEVVAAIEKTKKEIIPISLEQMNHFAGNMLQVENNAGENFLVMSSQAFQSLTHQQVLTLEKFNPILHSSLDTIERNGGGSARCMMAEIFLPAKN